MLYRTIGVILTLAMTASCGGGKESTKIKALQKKDKNLSCKEILLEMNEAEFYRDTAYKNRGPRLKNILMPLGYVTTYMDAEEAIEAADARVSYLDRIYEILRCDDKIDKEESEDGQKGKSNHYAPLPYYEQKAKEKDSGQDYRQEDEDEDEE